jgi:hypothetical protein
MKSHIKISPRFCGPPDSGNGGYSAGLLAAYLQGDVRVKLLAPPPLDVPLTVEVLAGKGRVLQGSKLILVAEETHLQWEQLPSPPAERLISHQRQQCRGFRDHAFPNCFVCGPQRQAGDGLCIYPGPLEQSVCGAIWEPDKFCLDPATGAVATPYVWAALDCPSAFPLLEPEQNQYLVPMVLGTLAVSIRSMPVCGSRYRILSWAKLIEGRKGTSRSVIYDGQDQAVAYAEALWISLNKF